MVLAVVLCCGKASSLLRSWRAAPQVSRGHNPDLFLWMKVPEEKTLWQVHDALLALTHDDGADAPPKDEELKAAHLTPDLQAEPVPVVVVQLQMQVQCLTIVLNEGQQSEPLARIELRGIVAEITARTEETCVRFGLHSLMAARRDCHPGLSSADFAEGKGPSLAQEHCFLYSGRAPSPEPPPERPGAAQDLINIACTIPQPRDEAPVRLTCDFDTLCIVVAEGFVEVLEFVWDCTQIVASIEFMRIIHSVPALRTCPSEATEKADVAIQATLKALDITWMLDEELLSRIEGRDVGDVARAPRPCFCARMHEVSLGMVLRCAQDSVEGTVGRVVLHDYLMSGDEPNEVLRGHADDAQLKFRLRSIAKWVRRLAKQTAETVPPFSKYLAVELHSPHLQWLDKHITVLRLHLSKSAAGQRLAALTDRPLFQDDSSFDPVIPPKSVDDNMQLRITLLRPTVTLPPSHDAAHYLCATGASVVFDSSLFRSAELSSTGTCDLMEQFAVTFEGVQLTTPTLGPDVPRMGAVSEALMLIKSPLPDPINQTSLTLECGIFQWQVTEQQYLLFLEVITKNFIAFKRADTPPWPDTQPPGGATTDTFVLKRQDIRFRGLEVQFLGKAQASGYPPISTFKLDNLQVDHVCTSDLVEQTVVGITSVAVVDERECALPRYARFLCRGLQAQGLGCAVLGKPRLATGSGLKTRRPPPPQGQRMAIGQ